MRAAAGAIVMASGAVLLAVGLRRPGWKFAITAVGLVLFLFGFLALVMGFRNDRDQ